MIMSKDKFKQLEIDPLYLGALEVMNRKDCCIRLYISGYGTASLDNSKPIVETEGYIEIWYNSGITFSITNAIKADGTTKNYIFGLKGGLADGSENFVNKIVPFIKNSNKETTGSSYIYNVVYDTYNYGFDNAMNIIETAIKYYNKNYAEDIANAILDDRAMSLSHKHDFQIDIAPEEIRFTRYNAYNNPTIYNTSVLLKLIKSTEDVVIVMEYLIDAMRKLRIIDPDTNFEFIARFYDTGCLEELEYKYSFNEVMDGIRLGLERRLKKYENLSKVSGLYGIPIDKEEESKC